MAKTLKDMYEHLLQDTYSAETQLVKALPKMAEAAKSAELRAAFEQHLAQTKTHVQRLEQVGQTCGIDLDKNTCEAMEGLVEEGEEVMSMDAESDALDAALIASAQKVEHYEIASYGTLCEWAKQLGKQDCCDLLKQTLTEEKATDEKLTRIAESRVNRQAVTA